MGPRIFIRGYGDRRLTWRSVGCFNGAADFHPRIHGRRNVVYSGTAGFNGAADFHPRIRGRRRLQILQVVRASMGPRIFIRGYGDPMYGDPTPDAASMGPRIFIRGYPNSPGLRTRDVKLQWGRGFSSADTDAAHGRQPRGTSFNGAADFHPRILPDGDVPVSVGPLQWGRGFSSADTNNRPGNWPHPCSFNGAADFHPRIRLELAIAFIAAAGFNGAADFHPRIPNQRRRHEQRRSSFNGAADFHPRIPHVPAKMGLAISRFNGAADFHPRIHALDWDDVDVVAASMGPRIFIRGYAEQND